MSRLSRGLSVCFLLSALALAGCSFSRSVVNAHVCDLDTSWIVPGQTTREDVIERLGRPPSVLGVEGDGQSRYYEDVLSLRPQGVDSRDEDVDDPAMNAFRWYAIDSFTGMFEGGHWVIPTFSRGYVRRVHDLLVLFDRQDVVSLVSRTEVVDGRVRILEWKERP